jgi:hypothetical protein
MTREMIEMTMLRRAALALALLAGVLSATGTTPAQAQETPTVTTQAAPATITETKKETDRTGLWGLLGLAGLAGLLRRPARAVVVDEPVRTRGARRAERS